MDKIVCMYPENLPNSLKLQSSHRRHQCAIIVQLVPRKNKKIKCTKNKCNQNANLFIRRG